MDDSSAVLSGSVLKLLTNPNYEKRKAAALELEKVIRESPPEKIKRYMRTIVRIARDVAFFWKVQKNVNFQSPRGSVVVPTNVCGSDHAIYAYHSADCS